MNFGFCKATSDHALSRLGLGQQNSSHPILFYDLIENFIQGAGRFADGCRSNEKIAYRCVESRTVADLGHLGGAIRRGKGAKFREQRPKMRAQRLFLKVQMLSGGQPP